jgi:hypothetical protein
MRSLRRGGEQDSERSDRRARGHGDEPRGRSVLSATTSQRAAALALIEFDGVARRTILYPPDLPLGNLPHNIETLRWVASCPMGNLLNWARHRRGSSSSTTVCQLLLSARTPGRHAAALPRSSFFS